VRGFVGLLENVIAAGFVKKFAGGRVERDAGLVRARFVACGRDGFDDDLDGFFVGFATRGEATFVTDSGVVAALFLANL